MPNDEPLLTWHGYASYEAVCRDLGDPFARTELALTADKVPSSTVETPVVRPPLAPSTNPIPKAPVREPGTKSETEVMVSPLLARRRVPTEVHKKAERPSK
jgi:hypothetical protein